MLEFIKNNTSKLYYTPPDSKLFDELKSKAMELWKIVDTDNDKYGYATEKISQIKDLQNVGDNFMYIVAMFDSGNQRLLAGLIDDETKLSVRKRMIDGGMLEELIYF